MHEAELLTGMSDSGTASKSNSELESQLAQVALDAAEWLKTLWNVGYMGAGSFPSQPRSAFPLIELEDILKSALFLPASGKANDRCPSLHRREMAHHGTT